MAANKLQALANAPSVGYTGGDSALKPTLVQSLLRLAGISQRHHGHRRSFRESQENNTSKKQSGHVSSINRKTKGTCSCSFTTLRLLVTSRSSVLRRPSFTERSTREVCMVRAGWCQIRYKVSLRKRAAGREDGATRSGIHRCAMDRPWERQRNTCSGKFPCAC